MNSCFNSKTFWQVAAVLAAVGVGVAVLAPGLLAVALPLLLLALCPLTMFLMMWGMGRMGGMRAEACSTDGTPDAQDRATRIAALKAQRDSIAREINELEAPDAAASAELEGARRR